MYPRFIAKTHTEALRPGNYSLLIEECTFPDKGAYAENVLKTLEQRIKEKSVAKFTVMLATEKNRGFGFLLDNMIWSWKGHTINAVLNYINKIHDVTLRDYYELTAMEKILYLRFYLETDGAMIFKLAEKYCREGSLSYSNLKNSIQEIIGEIYDEYMDMATDFRIRSRIRAVRRQTKLEEKYDAATLPHKINPHLQALADLGLIEVEEGHSDRVFNPTGAGSASSFNVICSILGNLRDMEKAFSEDDYFPLIARAYGLMPTKYSASDKDLLRDTVSYGYKIMRDRTTGMADIDALVNWCCIKMLAMDDILVDRAVVQNYFDEARKRKSANIQYHLDGTGRIAYLILAESE